MKILAIVLIVTGLAGIGWGGFEWSNREKVVDLGPVEISKDKYHSVPIPPVLGALALASGAFLLFKRD